jgi:phage/plasmid-associated DNA primase
MSVNPWDFSVVAPTTNMPQSILVQILDDKIHPITIEEIKKDRDGDIRKEIASPSGILHAIRTHWAPIRVGKELYIYDPELCYYRKEIGDIQNNIGACLQLKGVFDPPAIKKAIENLTHHSPVYPFVEGKGTLNIINGIFDIKTGKLLSRKRGEIYDYIIRTPYIPQPTVEVDALLESFGNDEPVQVLAKCLWQRAWVDTLKEMTIFYGPPDSGKTTAGELVQATLDGDLNSKNNTSRELLDSELSRFGRGPLEHKLYNLGDDLPDKLIRNSGKIAELVGSVHHQVELKGEDSYPSIITAYNLFTTNNLPPLDDDDSGIWSKMRLIEFKNNFQRGKPREEIFTDKIKQQLLIKAIALVQQWLITPYKNDQSASDIRKIWHAATDDAEQFFAEMLIPSFTAQTKYDTIKLAYEKWCLKNKRTLHIKNLNKNIKSYHRHDERGNYYSLTLRDTPDTPDTRVMSIIQPAKDPVVTILNENAVLMEITFDISHHKKFKVKDTVCSVRGCGGKGEWHDPTSYTLPHPLCDRHYQMLRG